MILLTTPFDASGIDPSHPSYTHIKIMWMNWDARTSVISVGAYHGYLDGGDFVSGVEIPKVTVKQSQCYNIHVGPTQAELDIDPNAGETVTPNYDTMVSKLTSDIGVLVYEEVARELYQWLLDESMYVGTIV